MLMESTSDRTRITSDGEVPGGFPLSRGRTLLEVSQHASLQPTSFGGLCCTYLITEL